MMKKRKGFITVRALFVLIVFLALFGKTAFAAQTEGSILLRCAVERDGRMVYLGGDEFALFQIARAEKADDGDSSYMSYRTLPDFADFDCDWGSLRAEEAQQKAEALAASIDMTENALALGVTDSAGETLFDRLEPGVYFILRMKIAEVNRNYVEEPVLVMLPEIVNGVGIYSVVAEPKIRWIDPDTPTDPENPDEPPGDVNTGDDMRLQTFAILAGVSGLLCLGLGIVLINDRRKEHRKESQYNGYPSYHG